MSINITSYNAVCNLGNNINAIFSNAIAGNINNFSKIDGFIDNKQVYVGLINCDLPEIAHNEYNLRCNRAILKVVNLLELQINTAIKKYGNTRIGIVAATTNSGVEEFETSNNPHHFQLGNPSEFLAEYLGVNGYYSTVSTACSSGIKAFSISRDLLNYGIADCVIVVCVDTLAKVPLYGFDSLEVLSTSQSLPFSKNRKGMNIGEACAVFIMEKNSSCGIEIMGIGENSDIYHITSPDPDAKAAINAINMALNQAHIKASDIDYINAHGTGTLANDYMESKAINVVFGENTPVSSTKPMTGHCLGAAAGIETALCCALLDNFNGKLFPNIFDDNFDDMLNPIKLVTKTDIYKKCNICMCNSFGFGGTNAILILGKNL